MNSESESSPPVFSDHADPHVAAPRNSKWAVTALVTGLASAAALLHPYLWFLAGLGLMVSALVLIRLPRAQPPAGGFGLAQTGLVLSILFASWAPTSYYLRQNRLNKQAIAVSQQWLQFLVSGQPHKAFGAMSDPQTRPALDDNYREMLLASPSSSARFQRFQRQKLVAKLSRLGPRADIRHARAEEQFQSGSVDRFVNLFTITYVDEDQQKKSLFVRIRAERTDNPVTTTGFWRIMSYQQGAPPT